MTLNISIVIVLYEEKINYKLYTIRKFRVEVIPMEKDSFNDKGLYQQTDLLNISQVLNDGKSTT